MSDRRCPYCQQLFQPSRFHPEQVVCSHANCQRRRQHEYHRRKIASDPVYRQVCLESPRKWRAQHPDYWKQYRQTHLEAVERNRQKQRRRDQKRRLVHLANNNLALDLKRSAAEVWLLGPEARHLANNNLPHSQVLILQAVAPAPASSLGACQQHPSGVLRPPCPTRERMLKAEPINEIQQLYHGEHWSVRKIARHLHLARKTIRKAT